MQPFDIYTIPNAYKVIFFNYLVQHLSKIFRKTKFCRFLLNFFFSLWVCLLFKSLAILTEKLGIYTCWCVVLLLSIYGFSSHTGKVLSIQQILGTVRFQPYSTHILMPFIEVHQSYALCTQSLNGYLDRNGIFKIISLRYDAIAHLSICWVICFNLGVFYMMMTEYSVYCGFSPLIHNS